jgi:hypothetical protein
METLRINDVERIAARSPRVNATKARERSVAQSWQVKSRWILQRWK